MNFDNLVIKKTSVKNTDVEMLISGFLVGLNGHIKFNLDVMRYSCHDFSSEMHGSSNRMW